MGVGRRPTKTARHPKREIKGVWRKKKRKGP
jgi:hypothetical protein